MLLARFQRNYLLASTQLGLLFIYLPHPSTGMVYSTLCPPPTARLLLDYLE